MSLAAFGVRKPVVANLVMFAILGAGLIYGLGLRREFFPETRPNQVVVTAPYPGAAPDEVEDALAIKIEDAIDQGVDDIKEMRTSVSEGVASITIEFEPGVEIEAAVAEVQRRVDSLQDLPEDAERIVVAELEPNLPVIVLSLRGSGDERELKQAIRRIRDDLDLLDGMGQIAVGGIRTDEIRVEVRPEAQLEHGLSLPWIAQRIRESMRELPGGTVKSETANYSVRTEATEERAAQIADIPVRTAADGRVVRLGEVAQVTQGFADVDLRARLNGEPAVSLTVFKVGDDDAVDMAELVKAYAAGLRGEALELTWRERLASMMRPPSQAGEPVSERQRAYELGVRRAAVTPLPGEVVLTTDLARYIVGRLELLTRNALWGGVLVFATLLVLLSWRTSLWVAIGLTVSIAGTLALMNLTGVTINLLTMFGLIIVLGLLVDDAIVVAENITARHEGGEDAETAAIRGTGQVGWPVVSTVLTTVCAFLPLALIEGRIGDLLQFLPFVVAVALGISLVEALFILPMHIAHSLKGVDRRRARGHEGWLSRFESRFDRGRDKWIYGTLVPGYVRLLVRLVRHRYLTVVGAFAMMVVSFGLLAGGRLEFIFFETSDSETVNGSLQMPIGTPASRTDEVLRRLEAAAMAQPEVSSAYGVVGQQSDLNGESVSAEQSHLGQLILELVPVEERDRTSEQVRESIRLAMQDVAGIKSLRMEEVGGGPGGPPITLSVVGNDPRAIERVIEEIKHELAKFEGVVDIADDADLGQRELRLELRDGASELGFTVQDVAQQMRGTVLGLEAYTYAGEREDVDVRVLAPESVRRSLAAVENALIFTPAGDPVPLGEVVRLSDDQAYATIRRIDRQRAVTVTADVRRSVTNPESVMASLRPTLEMLDEGEPSIRILERGRQKDVQDSFATLPLGMAVAAGLIYVILAWLFSSFVQPLVVMSAIPFATIGMIWGHMIMGYTMTFLSLIGFVALSGVVVNDSLIFMEFFNERRREGMRIGLAVLDAGRARFRAILLTTVTTVLGLSPLMLEQSFQAKFLVPMAITISFGLMSATGIILIVLPCLLMIVD
ncbi:MAG: efflux RND transporter permease subunit, partial [Phycisphaerales bacterium JB037]